MNILGLCLNACLRILDLSPQCFLASVVCESGALDSGRALQSTPIDPSAIHQSFPAIPSGGSGPLAGGFAPPSPPLSPV